MSNRHRSKKLAPFVPLYKETMKTPAWQALSNGARMLYVMLKWNYNTKLQNHVFLSTRDAALKLGSNRSYVRRWFSELQYYGFIVMIRPGGLGVEGHGKSPHYRLTEEWYLGKPPTRDFLNWGGEVFRVQKSPKHYLKKIRVPWSSSGPSVGPVVDPVAATDTGQ
jgi:hypothetical protein